jgi:hypothetical protein
VPPDGSDQAPSMSYKRRGEQPSILSRLGDALNPFASSEDFPQGQYPSLFHPDYHSFNERLTRTPGIVKPASEFAPGVDAQYERGPGFPGTPGNPPGTIYIKPDSNSNMISHEAAHGLYNQTGMYRYGNKLEDKMNPVVADMIGSSRHYQRAIEQDPSALTDEGLGYAMNYPVPADESYVNAVAARVEDPVKKQQLLNLFQHAKAMADPSFKRFKTKDLHKLGNR